MALNNLYNEAIANPLDVVENVIDGYQWSFDRSSDQEMAVRAPGRWCDYSLYFSWSESAQALHFSCALDIRVPMTLRTQFAELLCQANSRLWMGHFGGWEDDGAPYFRHALPLRGTGGPNEVQMTDLVETAIHECERFFPAFQHVLWGGKSPEDAIAAAMIETVGEA